MAFFQLLLKARKLEKARRKYEDEKFLSIEISKGAKPKYTLKQQFRRRKLLFKKKVKKFIDKILTVPKSSWFYKKIIAIRTDGTLANYVAKSFFGFISGIFLTYMFFVFFVFQLNFKLSSATTICTIIGVILTLGLAFSYQIRCIVLLLLPQFFSKRGRQALMSYAFILALTGPVKNTLHNTSVLTESLACAQEQLKEAVKTVVDLAKQPFYALRDAISKVIKSVKVVVKKIKQTLVAIKRLVLSILRVITSVFQWLGSIINICNKKLGTPFDRCQRVFEGAVADCKAKLGPYFGVVCNITYVVSTLCYVVKPLDFICMLVSYVADTVVGAVRAKIKNFTMHMKAMFYVKVKFSHSFQFETNQSKTVEEVSTSIATEIRSRTDALFGFFDWMSFVTSFFTFFILLRVMRYRYKWLTSERFDNRYITDDLRTIDLIRARQDKETVLPLNPREKNRYAPLSSVMLIRSEKLKLARSMVFLCLATIKLASYMMIDYSLYWVLNTIQLHGRFQSKVERPTVVTIHVSGEGYLSDLYRSIVKAFTPHGKDTEIDTMVCLPAPVTPDLDKYTQIISLIVFCWLMLFLEPYGLRLRQVVMCQYYPDRAKQRAAWLYNHIIRSRGSFLKFARRQLRRKFGLTEGEKIERVTLKERLWATLPCLRFLFPLKQNMCLLCGAIERDDNLHIKCPTPGCVGRFCTQCFADLQNVCTICQSPIEYGDLSDMSEEKDSSDDQLPVIKIEPPKAEEKEEEAMEEETEEEEGEEEIVTEEEKEERTEELEEEQTEAEDEEEEEKEEQEQEEDEEEAEVKEDDAVEEEKVEKEVALQTDDKYVEDSDSTYSYTYQDEHPPEVATEKCREPFKDLEAQKIRDDVTIQIFNEPFVKDTSSSCESPSGFVVRARRNVRARLKKRSAREKDSDSSTSIADTESWSTEEVDEEEVIHIEMDDSSEELLPKDRKDKEKRGRINKIVCAVARIPWLGKGEDDKKCKGLRSKRPSLMDRIVSMLHKKESMPVQSYRRSRKIKDSSSSSTSCDDETETLLSSRDDRHLTRRRIKRTTDESDETKNLNLRHPCEKRFVTKRLPRYLESTARSTSYFEVDETEDSRIERKRARQVEDINKLSSKASSGAKKRDDWNITEDDELVGSCSCTSEIAYETTRSKEILEMTTISEHSDDSEKRITETETEDTTTVSESEIDYTDETDSVKISGEPDDVKDTAKYPGESEDFTEYEEPVEEKTKERTKTEIIPATSKVRKKPEETEEKEKTSEKTKEKIGTNGTREDIKATKSEKKTKKVSEPPKEDTERIIEISTDTGGVSMYDPLAGLELYGVSYKSKEIPASTKLEIDVRKKSEEIEENEKTSENIKEKIGTNGTKKDIKATKSEKKTKKVSEPPKEDTERIVEISTDTGGASMHDPLAESELHGVSYKSKEKLAPTKQEIDAEKKAEENQTTQEADNINEKDLKKSDINEETKQTAPVKMDKSTDLPDRSRSTQTKLHGADKKKSKHLERISEAPDTREYRKISKESKKKLSKEDKKKKKRRKRHKEDLVKPGTSKRRKRSCSEKSTLTEDEEFYASQFEDKELPPEPTQKYPREERCKEHYLEGSGRAFSGFQESERWESHGNAYSPYDSHTMGTHRRYPELSYSTYESPCHCCPRNYESPSRDPRKIVHSETTKQVFEMPVVKKYLPMYQSPQLIEELKRHDRIKLIREREARERRMTSSPDSFSTCSRMEAERTNRSIVCDYLTPNKISREEDTLPYQETQAYKNVLREFQRRTSHPEKFHEKSDTIPLIHLSKKADKSKQVKLLYPPRRRSDAVKKFAKRIIAPFKIVPCEKHKQKVPTRLKIKGETCDECSFDPEIFTEISSVCDCSERTRKSDTLTCTDETTDNNESPR